MERITIERVRADLKTLKEPPDLTVAGILGLPEALRVLLCWIIRRRAVTCEQLAGFLEEEEEEACSLAAELVGLGFIEHVPVCGVPIFRVCLVPFSLKPPVELLKSFE